MSRRRAVGPPVRRLTVRRYVGTGTAAAGRMPRPESWEESLVGGQFRPDGFQQLHRFLKLLVDVSVRLLSRDGDLLDGFVESVPGTDSL